MIPLLKLRQLKKGSYCGASLVAGYCLIICPRKGHCAAWLLPGNLLLTCKAKVLPMFHLVTACVGGGPLSLFFAAMISSSIPDDVPGEAFWKRTALWNPLLWARDSFCGFPGLLMKHLLFTHLLLKWMKTSAFSSWCFPSPGCPSQLSPRKRMGKLPSLQEVGNSDWWFLRVNYNSADCLCNVSQPSLFQAEDL